MNERNRREKMMRTRERMGGLFGEKKTCSRDPSWLQIALHVPQGFKSCQAFFGMPLVLTSGRQGRDCPL